MTLESRVQLTLHARFGKGSRKRSRQREPRRRSTSHHVRFGGGPSEKGQLGWYLAGGLPDPKPGSSEQRPLSIPAVRDRIVQAALKIVLEPIFEAGMQPCSFGF